MTADYNINGHTIPVARAVGPQFDEERALTARREAMFAKQDAKARAALVRVVVARDWQTFVNFYEPVYDEGIRSAQSHRQANKKSRSHKVEANEAQKHAARAFNWGGRLDRLALPCADDFVASILGETR